MPAARPRRWLGLALAGAVVVIVVLLIAVLVLLNRPPPPQPPPPPPASPATSAGSSAPAAEALPRSEVPVGAELASGSLGPLYTGYPQTPEGAVAASMNALVAFSSQEMYDDRTRHQVDSYIYVDQAAADKFGVSDETAAAARKKHGLDEHGAPLDKTQHVYSATYPEYGAFQVVEVKGNTEVTVRHWGPTLFGVGTTLDDLEITWTYAQLRMVWADGDWRIAAHEETTAPPQPEDPAVVWVSFAERASLLGKGWQLPANASEEPIERLELPEK